MTSFTLKDLLRSTLAQVELSSDLPKDGPAFSELKTSLIRAIAELTVIRNEQSSVEHTEPFPVLSSRTRLD